MMNDTMTLTLNAATFALVMTVLQQNGHPKITEEATAEAIIKAVKQMQENE